MDSGSATTRVTFTSSAWKEQRLQSGGTEGWKSMQSILNLKAPPAKPLEGHVDNFLGLLSGPAAPSLPPPVVGHLFLHTLEPHRTEYQRAGVHYLTQINESASWNDLIEHLLVVEKVKESAERLQRADGRATRRSRANSQPGSSRRDVVDPSETTAATSRPRSIYTYNPTATARTTVIDTTSTTRPNLQNLLISSPQAAPATAPDTMDVDADREPLAGFSREEMAAIDVMMGFRRG